MAGPVSQGADLDTLGRVVEKVRGNIKRVIEGKPDVITSAITVLLAEGHLLIEDVPGVGKTMLAKSLARSIDCSVRRIQFTPDLLPSDVTGVSVYNQESREFEFRPGGVFANIVVGDEINRASPKTQSALLECMEERQVTVDNTTYHLDQPFMVIATQNPIEMEGTYALPEAQRDRFMIRLSRRLPGRGRRDRDARLPHHDQPARRPRAGHRRRRDRQADRDRQPGPRVAGRAALHRRTGRGHPSYLRAVRWAPRPVPRSTWCARPRRPRPCRAATTCCPTTCSGWRPSVLTHRLLPSVEAAMGGRTTASILDSIIASVPVPEGTRA